MLSAGYHICTRSIYGSSSSSHLSSQVWKVAFWMQLHGSPTPKRTICFSNGAWIGGLDLGKLTKRVREQSTEFKTSRRDLTALGFRVIIVSTMHASIPLHTPGHWTGVDGALKFQCNKRVKETQQQPLYA